MKGKKVKISRIWRRIAVCCLAVLLCLGVASVPFGGGSVAPTKAQAASSPLENAPTYEAQPSLELYWKEGTACEDSDKRLAKSVNADRWVVVKTSTGTVPEGLTITGTVITFDMSARASNGDYTQIEKKFTLTSSTPTATVQIVAGKQQRFASQGGGGAVGATALGLTHTRIFGVKLASVSQNAKIDADKSTLYARTGLDNGLINTSTGTTGAYRLLENKKELPTGVGMGSYIDNGFTYSTAVSSGSNVTYDKSLGTLTMAKSGGSGSKYFMVHDLLDKTALSYYDYFTDTELYYTGSMSVTDSPAVQVWGFSFSLGYGHWDGETYVNESTSYTNVDNNQRKQWKDDKHVEWFTYGEWDYKVSSLTAAGTSYSHGYGGNSTTTVKKTSDVKYIPYRSPDSEHTYYTKLPRGKVARVYGKNYAASYQKQFIDMNTYGILLNEEQPKVVDVSVFDGTTKDKNVSYYRSGDYVNVAVHFSKPVQVGRDSNGTYYNPQLKVKIGGTSYTFDYFKGTYTDTLIFRKKLTSAIGAHSAITVEGFTDATVSGNLIGDMMLNVRTLTNGQITNTNNLANLSLGSFAKSYSCNIDTRTPDLRVVKYKNAEGGYEYSTGIKQEHSVHVVVEGVDANTSLDYVWTTNKSENLLTLAESQWAHINPVGVGEDTPNVITGKNLNGVHYLHLRVVGKNGLVKLQYGGMYEFDNISPTVETSDIATDYSLYRTEHEIRARIEDERSGISTVTLYMQKKTGDTYEDVTGQNGKFPWLVYDSQRADKDNPLKYNEEGGYYYLSIDDKALAMPAKTQEEYRVGFKVVDKASNVTRIQADGGISDIYYDSRPIYFDTNETFGAATYGYDGKGQAAPSTVQPIAGKAIYTYDKPVYQGGILQTEGNPLKLSICGETVNQSDTYTLFSVKLDGKSVYADGGWTNGKTAADYGFAVDPAGTAGEKQEGSSYYMYGRLEFNYTACGQYEITYQCGEKKSTTQVFYVSASDGVPSNYQAIYAEDRLLVNRVWQITTNVYCNAKYLDTGLEAQRTLSYSKDTANRPIFSSREKAMEYVRFKEKQDIQIVVLDEQTAAILDQNAVSAYKKAAGYESKTALAGQTWLKYKSIDWTVGKATDSYWVYYFYSDSQVNKIDEEAVKAGTVIGAAIENNVNDIVGTASGGATVNFTLMASSDSGSVDIYGQPAYPKGAIFNRTEELLPTDPQSVFSVALQYAGDSEIYSNTIKYTASYTGDGVETKDVALISNYVFTLNGSYSSLYYRAVGGGSAWNLIENGKTLKQTFPHSGLYEIAELNGGYRSYYIYCDFEAPIIVYGAERGGQALKDESFTSAYHDPEGKALMTAESLTLKSFLPDELDEYAYVCLEGNGKTYTYTMAELNASSGVQLPKGVYTMSVYDRLGNITTCKIRTNPEVSAWSAPEVTESSIHFDIDRETGEISKLSIEYNGEEIVSEWDGRQTYTFHQSGYYTYRVKDIYGYEYFVEHVEFIRKAPGVSFYYFDEATSTYKSVPVIEAEESVAENAGAVVRRSASSENAYSITTSKSIRIQTDRYDDYAFWLNKSDISYRVSSGKSGEAIYDVPCDKGTWTAYLCFASDQSDLSTIVITCEQDAEKPTLTAAVEVETYAQNDVLYEGDGDGAAGRSGNVLFDPSKKTVVNSYLSDKDKVSGRALVFTWEDDTGVIEAKYSLDGKKAVPVPAASGSFTAQTKGHYVVTVVDLVGNVSTFEATLTDGVSFDMEVGGEPVEFSSEPETLISGTGASATWEDIIYTGKDIVFTLHEGMQVAFLYRDGTHRSIYYLDYVGTTLTPRKLDIEDATESRTIALIDGNAEDIFTEEPFYMSYTFINGKLTFTIPKPTGWDSWQFRFTTATGANPKITEIERTNAVLDIGLFKGETPLEADDTRFSGTNEELSVRLLSGVLSSADTVMAYRSDVETKDFSNVPTENQYQLVKNGELQGISEEGYYKIVAINRYGNVKILYVRINYGMAIEVELEYADESVDNRTYGLEAQEEPYYFYTNGKFFLYVWDEETTVRLTEGEAHLYESVKDGCRYFEIRDEGEFTLVIDDGCQNIYTVYGSVQAPQAFAYRDYMTGFNTEAVLWEQNYTNAPLSLSKTAMKLYGAEYAAYRKVGSAEWTVLYDVISERKLDEEGDGFHNCIGGGDGEYEVLFTDKYGNICIETVHISSAVRLSITRQTQTATKEQKIPLESAQAQGVWSNFIVTFTNGAAHYRLTVNGERASFDENGRYKWELPLTTAEGSAHYDIVYVDEYGNKYAFSVNLYRGVPVVSMQTGGEVVNSGAAIYVKGEVAYVWEDDKITATYVRNGNVQSEYEKGGLLTEDGAYVLTFVDAAGNQTTARFTKDTQVACAVRAGKTELFVGSVVNSQVNLFCQEDGIVILSATKDGEPIDLSVNDLISEHGAYVLVLQDKIGNQKEASFEIYAHAMQSFTYQAHSDFVITQVWLEAGDVRLPYVGNVTLGEDGRQQYRFDVDGRYEVEVLHVPTNTYRSFKVTVDNVPPAALLSGVEPGGITRSNVKLTGLVAGDIVDVYRDGKLVNSYTVSTGSTLPEIDKAGAYKVVVRDAAGNEVVYEFEREFTTNTATNVMIVTALLGISILGIVFIRGRDQVRTK